MIGALKTSSSLLLLQISVLGGAVMVNEDPDSTDSDSDMLLGKVALLAVCHFAAAMVRDTWFFLSVLSSWS